MLQYLYQTLFLLSLSGQQAVPQDTFSTPQYQYAEREVFNYVNIKKYVFSHLHYPKEAYDNDIEGEVLIGFFLTPTGDIDSIRVLRSAHPVLDEAAAGLIREMPPWRPVYENGKAIYIQYEVPISFEISRYKEEKTVSDREERIILKDDSKR